MWARPTKLGLTFLVALALHALPLKAETAGPEPAVLQLDVKVNGFARKLIGAFKQFPDGHMESTRSELTELGIVVPGEGPADESIALEKLSGVTYAYDQASQSIDIKLPSGALVEQEVKAFPTLDIPKAQSSMGAVLNYTAFSYGQYRSDLQSASLEGANLTLDGRIFSKLGTLRQTGVLGTTTFSDYVATRLDSTWSYADQDRMLSYKLGDIISGGLRWTRPVRMGGGQVQRNFSLRPDLITMPLPFITGTAAVPSTLDVYIGDIKAYSNQVDQGRFNIADLPITTNTGKARMVLTDSTGRKVETETDFYTSPDLLKKNLYDFSADVGVVRRSYGTESFGYDDQPVGLGSVRYGLSNAITGEAHVEAKSDLIDAGFGAVLSAREFGILNGAVAVSKFQDKQGFFVHAGWEGSYKNFTLQASTSRTFGDFYDLAAATELPSKTGLFSGGVPRALDQISIGYNIPSLKAGVGASLIHQIKDGADESLLLSASYSQQVGKDITVFANAYNDFGPSADRGIYVGFSMPLGGNINSTAGVTHDHSGLSASAQLIRPFGEKPGDYGWRVNTNQNTGNLTTAAGSYRTGFGVASAEVDAQNINNLQANASFSGAAIAAGGGVFLGDQINDAFAVVDAGAEGIKVDYENRYVGKTGKNGKLLLPNMHSYHKNRISIDVNDLPIGASVKMSDTEVVPAEASGVLVDFGVKTDAAAVLVTLTDAAGKVIPEGSSAVLNGAGDPFVVGYDGQVYVTGAGSHNTLAVTKGNVTCSVNFDYKATAAGQANIGPFKCL